jgi:hypothetical protein
MNEEFAEARRAAWLLLFQSVGIIVSQMLDFGTTVVGLRAGATEMNGLVSYIITNHGESGFFWFKLISGCVFAVATTGKPIAAWALTLLCSGVALWNLWVLYPLIG